MKFGQSLAVSLAALLCTGSLALAQAPDKGGGGGMGGMGGAAPAEKMDRGQGGGGPGGAQDQPSRGLSGERGGPERGMSERGPAGEQSRSARPEPQGRERDQGRAERAPRDKDQDRAQRRDKDEERGQRAGRDRDQDKAQRTARDKEQQRARDREQDRGGKVGRDKDRDMDQDRAQRRDADRDQGKAAQGRDRDGQPRQANRVQASEKQHTEVRQHLLRDRKVERTRLNISVNIGARVPRSVRLYPVSSVIIGFAPVYRGYSYIVLEDETICIVDPRSYEIVDVIPASTQRAERPRGDLTLSADERRLVLTSIDKDRSADINVRLALGAEIPRSVEVVTFPDRVLERVPQLRSYRYVVVEDQVVIVDPEDRQVALLIND
jgi:hypothetical protein